MPIREEFSPTLHKLIEMQLDITPELKSFFDMRFSNVDSEELKILNQLSKWVIKIASGDLYEYCQNYGFLTKVLLEEELYFRRNNSYRRSTFEECNSDIYSNEIFMDQYLNGLLLSQIYWSNHTNLFKFYIEEFLDQGKDDSSLLEIGPGHGLLLAYAANHNRIKKATGYDISKASILKTTKTLNILGVSAELFIRDAMESDDDLANYDLIVLSEVLEHLEKPADLLSNLYKGMAANSKIFISMPLNSPAPDHIYLLSKPEEVAELVTNAGYTIEKCITAPATNTTIERAIKKHLTISTGIIAYK